MEDDRIDAGPQNYTELHVNIWPTEYVQPAVDNMPEILGEPVAGMGDAAFMKTEEESRYTLTILVRDRFGLEVSADTEAWTLTLAQLFLSRLLGP